MASSERVFGLAPAQRFGTRPRVCLVGAKLDSGNMGVSALTASLVGLVRSNWPDAEVTLLVSNRSDADQALQVEAGEVLRLRVANYRMSPRSPLGQHIFWILFLACVHRLVPSVRLRSRIASSNRFLKSVEEADLVGDIRGGDSFSDIYGTFGLAVSSLPAVIALLLGKTVVLLPQTFGPYRRWVSRRIATLILRRARAILARDLESVDVAKGLLGREGGAVQFCPDVAFTLPPIEPRVLAIRPPLPREAANPLIGINVSGLLYMQAVKGSCAFGLAMDYREFAVHLSLALLQATGARLLYVPHTFSPPYASDTIATLEVIQSLPSEFAGRIHVVEKEYDQSEVKHIIGRCDFFVGSRMHACIAAISQGIPTVGVAYSKKFAGVFGSVGMADMVVDARVSTADEAIATILKRYTCASLATPSLEGVKHAQAKVRSTFRELLATPVTGKAVP